MTPQQRDINHEIKTYQHIIRRARRVQLTCGIAIVRDFVESEIDQHYCGMFDVLCTSCHAKNFSVEQPCDKLFTQCCSKVEVVLDPIHAATFIQ